MLSIQKQITNEIINALQEGVKPWACPWSVAGQNCLPVNYLTGSHYTGINIALLWSQCYKNNYSSAAWLTFNQVKKLNGTIIKGSKGARCVFYKLKEFEDEYTGELKQAPLINQFMVFNLDQISGIERKDLAYNEFNPIERGEQIIKKTEAKLKFGGHRAFYRRAEDQIYLPEPEKFASPEDFYSTALHEIVHWTGHAKRLNRKKGAAFGDKDYAFEELVAELGSAFLCGELGLQGNLQHASYIKSWLKLLEEDSRTIFRAASLASKAHKFIKAFEEPASDLHIA